MAIVNPFIMSLALLQGLGASAACRCDRGAGELAVLLEAFFLRSRPRLKGLNLNSLSFLDTGNICPPTNIS